MKQTPDPEEYAFKVKGLARLEGLSAQGHIDLFYGDESGVSLLPCIPYGWQCKDEKDKKVGMPSTSGHGVNCFGLISRQSDCWFRTTQHSVTAASVAKWLDEFVQTLKRMTVIVLDNASVHRSKEVKRYRKRWEEQGLYVFYLPPYSPHLNLAETLWRKIKYEWLRPQDYENRDMLAYQVWQTLAAVGKSLHIGFGDFKQNIYQSTI